MTRQPTSGRVPRIAGWFIRLRDSARDRRALVAGAIFFDYNDYRTHIGDKGLGALKQRVHGVVDLYGRRKPSFGELRRESSPVESIVVNWDGQAFSATVKTMTKLPAYELKGYSLRWIVYGFGDLPMETGESELPDLRPGVTATITAELKTPSPRRVVFDVIRPTRYSAATLDWRG